MTAVRPEVSPTRAWSFPSPALSALPNGMRAQVFEVPGQYVASLRLAIDAPLRLEPRALEGIGTIMCRCLDEGTRTHGPEEMVELLERRGMAIGAGIGEKGIVVELDVPVSRFEEALVLLREILIEPLFGATEVRRQVRARLAEIDQELANPGHLAAIEFAATYYPPDDRRSRPTGGSAATVSAIEPADVAAFHQRVVSPVGATVVVAGEFGDLDAGALVSRILGSWQPPREPSGSVPYETTLGDAPGVTQTPPRAAAAVAAEDSRIVIVDRPGSVQTEFYVGCPGPSRETPEQWAAYPVLGFIVGGSPSARIDAVLREEKGYTYGMRATFRPRVGDGLFVASGSVRADVSAESLGLLLDILDEARDGFRVEETTAGVDFISKTAPGRFATADQIADEAVTRALDGTDTTYTTQVLEVTRALTPTALDAAYRQWIDGRWTIILVGAAAEIAEPIRALGRGTVTVVSA